MAILVQCLKCDIPFTTSSYGNLCPQCDGTIEREAAEKARFHAQTVDERLEELRLQLISLGRRVDWDGRIG